MKVLLLGATGLLGHNVLLQLTAAGHEVMAVVRRTDGIRAAAPCQTVVGSPLDDALLDRAAEGCNAVVNCAGVTDMSLRRLDDYRPVNVELCRHLVKLCQRHSISTLVHTSTVNTIGHGSASEPASEQKPMGEPFLHSLYAISKREGEQVVLDAAREHPDWHVIVVNPGFMLGAWDVKPSSGRMLLAAHGRRLMAAPPGGKSFVAVRDVAQAIVHALTEGVSGSRYIVAGSNMSIRDLYHLQADVLGYRQQVLLLHRWILAGVGAVGDLLRACGLRTEISSNNLRQLSVQEYYDGSLAVRDLNITYTPVSEAIKQFYQWKETQSSKR